MTKSKVERGLSLKEREEKVIKITETYRKTAMFEGAGTGAGGILLGIADFPLLLSIKMKFLFETATAYGYDVRDYRERLFILLLFQLAFAREDKKPELIERIEGWESGSRQLPEEEDYLANINWKDFQIDYRDYIDLVKMLQLLPGIGAVVGAVANYRLLSVLSETAINGNRLRIFANH